MEREVEHFIVSHCNAAVMLLSQLNPQTIRVWVWLSLFLHRSNGQGECAGSITEGFAAGSSEIEGYPWSVSSLRSTLVRLRALRTSQLNPVSWATRVSARRPGGP